LAKGYKFHSGGREDIDVRMLGKGRPFIIELENPRRAISGVLDVQPIYDAIHSDLTKVQDLRFVGPSYFDDLLKTEKMKSKLYTAVVWVKNKITPEMLESKLDPVRDLTLYQKTPLRVLHRRSLMTREKQILRMKSEYINHHFFKLHMLASAGTYIKEFVHSDLGRT
jgi:tRNA pseudouridine synthase 10